MSFWQSYAGETQVIPQGPAASQIAIKQLGTNGGGYFNANQVLNSPNSLFILLHQLFKHFCPLTSNIRRHSL